MLDMTGSNLKVVYIVPSLDNTTGWGEADSLEHLILREELCRQLGQAAHERVEQCHMGESIVGRYEENYINLLVPPDLQTTEASSGP